MLWFDNSMVFYICEGLFDISLVLSYLDFIRENMDQFIEFTVMIFVSENIGLGA